MKRLATSFQQLGRWALLCVLFTSLGLAGCDFLDPTGVENPRTTDEDLANAPEPTKSLLPGLRAQFARSVGGVVVGTETASDNFSIHGTGLGGNEMDFARDIAPNVAVVNSTGQIGVYWHLQELRALADFVIDEIAPNDENASNSQLAEAHYYRGMAYLMQGENYRGVPVEPDGVPLSPTDLLQRALSDLAQAAQLAGGGEFGVRSAAAQARAYRALGDATNARTAAQNALTMGGATFVFVQEYDDTSIDNAPNDYLVQRSLQEMQPLPRLDFLDPKYVGDESGIPIAKAEEMHLILAEVALSGGDEAGARAALLDALTVTQGRPTEFLNDPDERLDDELNERPHSAELMVAFEPGGPFRAGLVLNRPGPVDTPSISGTSVTADEINAASGTALIRLLYLMRQEIMLVEGRRLHDLGIRLPVMLREVDTNPNINEGDPTATVSVPAYIPAANEMDLYTPVVLYDGGNLLTNEISMLHDMNKILAEQRGLVITNPMLQ
ncbi:MAG: hypothetical protein ACE5G0_12090 [Rhodothermales bacterium]